MHTVNRLYESFQPSHYDLTLKIERVARQFSGTVIIEGTAAADSNSVSLHAKDLAFSRLTVNGAAAPYHSAENDELVIEVGCKKGDDLKFEIHFAGKITDGMHGMYPCYYEHEGAKKELIATQFESHHAREVFPCVDEPSAKATYDVTLITEDGVEVLGNMPIKTQATQDKNLVTTFETSPRMSSYLLAFAFGELHKVSGMTANGTEVNIWSTKSHPMASLEFALDVAVKSIEFFNDYFDTPYPLPKSDHIALPDFSSGAMENWGLITYREICLLADETTGISTKQSVAMVIAHELSHQWFGNLVTMSWWDDLWLNESFASIMEFVCLDELYPEWDIWQMFATHDVLSALRRDYLPGIQAVKTGVNHPDEISSLFDPSIVYAKGARLLDMVRAYVGDEAFRVALKSYFKQYAYGNTVGNDLWQAISAAAGEDIGAFMHPWLEQSGMPVVHVTAEDDTYTFTQEKFVIPSDGDKETIWPIPIHSADGYRLLSERSASMAAALPFNPGNHVHALYAYDEPTLATLMERLRGGTLSVVDRLSLLHETSLITRGGYTPTVDLLPLLDAYREEKSEPVWDIIGLVYGDLKRFVETDEAAEVKLKQKVSAHAAPLYDLVGLHPRANDDESTSKLRATIVGLLAYADDPNLVEDALALFRGTDDLSKLDGELRAIICTVAVRSGTAQDIQRVIDTHHTTVSADLKQDMSAALTGTRDKAMIEKLLGFITDEKIVRPQDVDRWFVYLIRNRYGRDAAWRWMIDNWSWIEEKFASDKSYDSFPRYAASAFSSCEWMRKYEEFFAPLKAQPALTRAIELGSKDIESRAEWLERDQAAVLDALKS
jgi:aminopeptidase N